MSHNASVSILHLPFTFIGYRFFVMEKMDNIISAMVPLLLKSTSSTKTINVGPIAVKLLECVKAVHETKNIIRDVKTENFMLTLDGGSGTTLEKKLASRIRLIDLAMATQWTTMYRESDEGEGLVGTPLYASLNCHSGKKTSFRDDLESLGYVISEILTQLYGGDPSKQLPWNNGKSDEDVGDQKQSLVEDEKSEFYVNLGNAKTIGVFKNYMNIVRGYTFKKVPDYDKLSEILAKLTVPRKTMAAIASSKRNSITTKKAATTKRTRGKGLIKSNAGVSAAKAPRRSSRNSTKSANIEKEKENSTGNLDRSFNEIVYEDAQQEIDEMDWEYTDVENKKPNEDSKPKARKASVPKAPAGRQWCARLSKSSKEPVIIDTDEDDEMGKVDPTPLQRRGVRIVCTEGPHKGETYEMEAGLNEAVVIGSNPTSKIGETLPFKKDKTLKTTHVRLDLAINRKLTTVKVTDKSKGETMVNRDVVKSTKAFINDTIHIGETSLKIQSL